MTKYAIVPVEPPVEMRECGSSHWSAFCRDGHDPRKAAATLYCSMLAARPALDADLLAALELARELVREGRSGDAGVLARALLRAAGQEDV